MSQATYFAAIDNLAAKSAIEDNHRRATRAAAARKATAHMSESGKSVVLSINRIEAEMLAGFDPIAAQQEQETMSVTNEPYLLGDNIPVLLNRIGCIKGFGDNDCEHPACVCGAMPINAEEFRRITPVRVADRQMDIKPSNLPAWNQEQHADHLESTRDLREAASFKHLLVMCCVTALLTTLAIVSSPFLLSRAMEVLKSWL